MNEINETARRILECDTVCSVLERNYSVDLEPKHIDAMARFWLLKGEIETAIGRMRDMEADNTASILLYAKLRYIDDEAAPTGEPYEYEYLFESNPSDEILIDGWLPVHTSRFLVPVEQLLAEGKIRKIVQ